MTDLLRFEDVTAGYDGTVVLERLSFTMPAEGALALLGRNGVGKTTLLATVMGLTTLLSGRILWDGEDIAAVPVHRRLDRGIGYVPQEREIFRSLSVHENLVVAARGGEWTPARVYDLFPRLAQRRRNYGDQLSGGEQQMLAIGRALVGNPRALLLDEPFEGLAPVIVDQLIEGLARIRRESRLAMILVEQHAELALEMASTTLVLDRGQVAWAGESRDLLADRTRLAALIGLNDHP